MKTYILTDMLDIAFSLQLDPQSEGYGKHLALVLGKLLQGYCIVTCPEEG